MRATRLLALAAACALAGCGSNQDASTSGDSFEEAFMAPPATARPWVRWWWPGGAVDDAVLASELDRIAALGFGGVEVQPFRGGLSDAELAADPEVATVGDPAQLAHVGAAAAQARERDLSFSITLGSGWPTGGVFSRDVRPRELLYGRLDVTGPMQITEALPVPEEPAWVAVTRIIAPVDPFDRSSLEQVAVLAAPLVDGAASPPILGPTIDVSSAITGGVLTWDVPPGAHVVLAIYRHAIGQHVLAGAYGGDPAKAIVIDHLDPAATATWLGEQAGPWLDALAPNLPDDVFIDSPELLGELPWSAALAERFRSERGYDPTPFVPWFFRSGGEAKYSDLLRGHEGPAAFASSDPLEGVRAREDYEDVRANLFAEAYVAPAADFASSRATKFRFQAHGGWGVFLDDYARADVPESEGLYAGGSTDFLELAASAAHVAGRAVASAEAFPTLTLGDAPLDLDDFWRLAGRAFGAGIGRLVFHGVPYPRAEAGGGHWYPFGAPLPFTQDFSDPTISPWLPSFIAAVTRLQWALAQGVDRAEVAWLLPERQIPDRVAVRTGHVVPEQFETDLSLALRSAGLVYDRISPRMLAGASTSDGTLAVGSAAYRGLLLSYWAAADPDTLDAALAAARAGVPVVVVGGLPARARGRTDAAARDARVSASAKALRPLAHLVRAPSEIAEAFAGAGLQPSLTSQSSNCPVLTVRHRETADEQVFFVFNEQQTVCTTDLSFAIDAGTVHELDPETGEARELALDGQRVSLSLPASRARVLVVRR